MPTLICNGFKGHTCGRAFQVVTLPKGGHLCPTCRHLRAIVGNRAKAQQQGYRRMSKR